MDLTPFIRTPSPREVLPPWLPPDLRAFYTRFDGVGRTASADYPVRLCQLHELAVVGLRDLHLFDDADLTGGWDAFSAVRIGIGCFFDESVYVLNAPVCPPGAIMAFGVDVGGPGGTPADAAAAEPGCLMLASSFGQWLDRLRVDGWHEYGFVPGELANLPPGRADALRRHFARLNPRAGVGVAVTAAVTVRRRLRRQR